MSKERSPADSQLPRWAKEHGDDETITLASGAPVGEKKALLTVGYHGPALLQDVVFVDEMAHFTRERIPERVVHAKGSGAFGYFEVTHDITQYSAAKVFSEIGKRTPIALRFSQVFGEVGYPDTVRDIRGYALRFYTDDGLWDVVGNNTPVFFIRDAIQFPSFIHVMKRNPETGLRDYNMFWDMVSLRPECIHQTLITWSDRGLPASYRNMHGYGSNTYGLVNADGKFVYCKFHFRTDQGIKVMSNERAAQLASDDTDYYRRDLYDAIHRGDFPSWSCYLQIMTPEQAAASPYNPFDVTKVWLQKDYPLIPFGRFVLNKNPTNFFAEIEQLGFDVSHLVPGIEPSPDRMLQGRIFAYADTHRYRLGVNHRQIPVNTPFRADNYQRDGYGTINNQGGAPNYFPNSFKGPVNDARAKALAPVLPLVGNASRYDSKDDDNYTQPRLLYQKVMNEQQRQLLVDNLITDVSRAEVFIQDRMVEVLKQVDAGLGAKVGEGLKEKRN